MVTVVSVGVTANIVRYPEPSGAMATSFEVISKSIIVFVGELILNEMLVYLPVRSTQPIIIGLDAIKAETALPNIVGGAVKCITPAVTIAVPGVNQVSVTPVPTN